MIMPEKAPNMPTSKGFFPHYSSPPVSLTFILLLKMKTISVV